MKYPYSVKHNGVWYSPNEEVPTNEPASVKFEVEHKSPVKEEPKAVEPVKEVVKSEEPEEVPVEPTYTKTEINRMPIVDLRRLARKHGVKKAADKSGAELKAELIELLNL